MGRSTVPTIAAGRRPPARLFTRNFVFHLLVEVPLISRLFRNILRSNIALREMPNGKDDYFIVTNLKYGTMSSFAFNSVVKFTNLDRNRIILARNGATIGRSSQRFELYFETIDPTQRLID